MRAPVVLLVLAASTGALRAEEEHSFWWRAKAEAARITDVIRICKGAMPNEDKVTDCMKGKKDQVSERCASFYPGGGQTPIDPLT